MNVFLPNYKTYADSVYNQPSGFPQLNNAGGFSPLPLATTQRFSGDTFQMQNLSNDQKMEMFVKTLFAILKIYENSNENIPPSKLPKNTKLNNEQLKNSQIIASTTKKVCQEKGLSSEKTKRAVEIALATAMQESGLRNGAAVRNKDEDSVGLFQQRPSCGWGTVAQCEDPVYATRKFASALLKTDFMNKSLSRAAQSVQRSAYPDAYAKHEGLAKGLTKQFFA